MENAEAEVDANFNSKTHLFKEFFLFEPFWVRLASTNSFRVTKPENVKADFKSLSKNAKSKNR
jgi:hypothetical protein